MRNLFFLIAIIATSLQLSAHKDVTKFLGIPIDGTRAEMIRRLKAKGFKSDSKIPNALIGEFNGKMSNIHIVTNRDKVFRIMVADATTVDESQIKINFNNLIYQFKDNPKYIPLHDSYIDDDEDISYQMNVNNKRYECSYLQKSTTSESGEADFNKLVWFMINEHYGKYYICLYYDNEYNKSHGEDL